MEHEPDNEYGGQNIPEKKEKEAILKEFNQDVFRCWSCDSSFFEKVGENIYRCKMCKKISRLVIM